MQSPNLVPLSYRRALRGSHEPFAYYSLIVCVTSLFTFFLLIIPSTTLFFHQPQLIQLTVAKVLVALKGYLFYATTNISS